MGCEAWLLRKTQIDGVRFEAVKMMHFLVLRSCRHVADPQKIIIIIIIIAD